MNTANLKDQKQNQRRKIRHIRGRQKQGPKTHGQSPHVLHEHELAETRMFR